MDWLVNILSGKIGLEPATSQFTASLVLAWFSSLIYFLKKNEKIILREHANLTNDQARHRLFFEFSVIFLAVVFCVTMVTPTTTQASLMTGILSEATIDHYLSRGATLLTKTIEAKIDLNK